MNDGLFHTPRIAITAFSLLLIGISSGAYAVCDYEPDAPDCSCFVDSGAWDPSGGYLQDIAEQTVGTVESCRCPGEPFCDWDPHPLDPDVNFADSAKPYDPMQLGNDEPFNAFSTAILIASGAVSYPNRGAWCSETVSYWHKHAYIPYLGGYRNDRHPDWQITNAEKLMRWYASERALRDWGGRGWWIHAHEVDYEDFELGRKIPVPGAYVAIRGYEVGNPDRWLDWQKTAHSLIIDEMWVHRDALGQAYRIEVTIKEGNANNQVRNSDWRHHDLAELLPRGSGWLGTRKIFGFGIDLDEEGTPIYDSSRLHYVDHPFLIQPFFAAAILAVDDYWDEIGFDKEVTYGTLLSQAGGLLVTSSGVQLDGIPDGVQHQWVFPQGLSEPVEALVDLRFAHPTPIRGIELRWEGHRPPQGYSVEYAGASGQFATAQVPDLANLQLPTETTSVAVPVYFDPNGPVPGVRFIQLQFPAGTFSVDGAMLQELRILLDQGPEGDAEDNPGIITHSLDCAGAYADKSCLWPANHKMVDVLLKGVTDPEGNPVEPEIFAITSDEPPAPAPGRGSRHAPDAFGIGSAIASLRVERSGKGDGRVYRVRFFANDGDRQCTGSVDVRVPHDKRSKDCLAVDSGQSYDATRGY